MLKKIALGLLVAAPLSAPAAANPVAGQSAAMTAQADNAVMLKGLETAARMSPSDGGAAIELANAYMRAGRTVDAMAHYRRALQLDDVMMQTRLGDDIWAHEIARKALAADVRMTAR